MTTNQKLTYAPWHFLCRSYSGTAPPNLAPHLVGSAQGRRSLHLRSVTLLVLLPATAPAGVIAPHFGLFPANGDYLYRFALGLAALGLPGVHTRRSTEPRWCVLAHHP